MFTQDFFVQSAPKMHVQECGSAATQRWRFSQFTLVPSGYHFLKPQAAVDYLAHNNSVLPRGTSVLMCNQLFF